MTATDVVDVPQYEENGLTQEGNAKRVTSPGEAVREGTVSRVVVVFRPGERETKSKSVRTERAGVYSRDGAGICQRQL
jgi:hypothetical protein